MHTRRRTGPTGRRIRAGHLHRPGRAGRCQSTTARRPRRTRPHPPGYRQGRRVARRAVLMRPCGRRAPMPSWPTTLMMLALIAQTPLLAMTVMILKEAASPTDRGSFQFLDVYWQVRPFFSLCCASCRSWSLFTLWWGVAFGPQPKIVGRVPGASVLCLCFLSFFWTTTNQAPVFLF